MIAWIGIILILILALYIGKYFYLKARGKPTGKFTQHNFDQQYSSEGSGYLLFLIIFLLSSYIGISIWFEVFNLFLL